MQIPDECLDWRTKGFWVLEPTTMSAFAAHRHPLFGGPFTWPVMVARRAAIDHNVATLAAFCRRHGLELAPHGKTTMAPGLFAAQLAAGAWGITLATANQVLAARALGVPRILLANELLDATALRWLAGERERDPGFDFLCYVDSLAGADAVSAALRDADGARPFQVLVELGYPGGRTGCRTADELLAVARRAAAADRIEVVGVAGYEGGLGSVDAVRAYLRDLRDAAATAADAGLLGDRPVVSVGGSAYFDLVADVLGEARRPAQVSRVILRSGGYITHDDGLYQRSTPFERVPDEGALSAALEVWAQVTSVPEAGRAIVAMGKREAPYDEGLPVPRRLRRRHGSTEEVTGIRVVKMNDHHTFLDAGPEHRLLPGDLVGFGISHPCTAFDKWQVIPVVDEEYRVVDLIRTYF